MVHLGLMLITVPISDECDQHFEYTRISSYYDIRHSSAHSHIYSHVQSHTPGESYVQNCDRLMHACIRTDNLYFIDRFQ